MSQDFYNSPEYLSLHDKSLDLLGLSPESKKLLTGVGLETVGDCVDYFIAVRKTPTVNFRLGIVDVMETEVSDKLKELGYWKVISDFIS